MFEPPQTAAAAALATLPPRERILLRLKALIGPGQVGKTRVYECLKRMGDGGSAWTHATLAAALRAMREQGLLTDELACAPGLMHPLAVEAIDSPEGAAMVAAVRAELPLGDPRVDNGLSEPGILRWQRLAVLLNDEEAFGQASSYRPRYSYYGYTPPSVFEWRFAAVEVGVDWFRSRRPLFQEGIFLAKAARWSVSGLETPDLPAIMDIYRSDPVLRAAHFAKLAEFELLTGRLERLGETLAHVPEGTPADLPVALNAARALLAGDPKGAVPLFAEALKLYRKAQRRRKGGLPGALGLLRLAALLAADDATLHAEVEAEAQAEAESGAERFGLIAVLGLLDLIRNGQARARAALEKGLKDAEARAPSPVGAGLLAVAAALVEPELVRRHADKVFVPLFRRVRSSMPLAAAMTAEALVRAGVESAPAHVWLARPDNEIAFRFLDLVAVKAPWERALDSLEAMLAPARPAAQATATRAKRLVWLVHPDLADIQPLEQSLQPRGWTAGRPVSLKRLQQGDPALDYLDDFDRRATRQIRRAAGSWGDHDTYECDPDTMLPALVGHPRVFDARSPGAAVELVEARPELVVSSEGSGFRLVLSHYARAPGASIEVETPGRWRVVVVDRKAVEAAEMLTGAGVAIPKSARDRLAAIARLPSPALPVRIDTGEIDDEAATDGDPNPIVRLSPLGDGLKVVLVVRPAGADGPHFLPGQGGRTVNAGQARVRRDLAAERRLAAALVEACPSLGGEGPEWRFDDLAASLELLHELRAVSPPPAMEWPEGRKIALRGEATLQRFRATVKGGEGWFAIDGTVEADEDLVLSLRELIERMEGSQGRFVPLGDGAFLALDRQFRQELERLSRLGDGLKIPAAAGVAVRDLVEGAASVKADARWKAFVRRLEAAEGAAPALPSGFEAELRDYQRDGFVWMSRLERWGAGALLADDMGLGKTVQAIAMMAVKAAAGPILVAAPTSVCGAWVAEIGRFAPGLRPIRLAETGDREEAIGSLSPGDALIVSYGLLAREQERLAAVPWAMAVLDEAQQIKNADTRRAVASRRLEAGFRLALTGTPVENDLDELWSLFAFVNPGLLGGREAFARRFVVPIARDNDARARAALRALVRPFLLRRTKAQVLAELPPRTEQTLLVEQEPEERAFYEALRRRALERLEEAGPERTRIHILAEITKLRQACCHPALAAPDCAVGSAKLEAFLDLLGQLREGRHRALVFSQFVGHLTKVRAALDDRGVSYQYLDGGTPAPERDKRVAAFQGGAGDLFLISLKAGGFGLNLTAADYVVHLDPWWNPAVESQASDRAHRIGQHRPVTIYRLIVKDSIEERILALHRQKRDLADALLEGADASASLSEEDLLGLMRGGE